LFTWRVTGLEEPEVNFLASVSQSPTIRTFTSSSMNDPSIYQLTDHTSSSSARRRRCEKQRPELALRPVVCTQTSPEGIAYGNGITTGVPSSYVCSEVIEQLNVTGVSRTAACPVATSALI
jgi:hypothetical protein